MRRLPLFALGLALLLFAAPPAPTNVNSQITNGAIMVRWDAVPGAVTYNIYRATQSHHETLYHNGVVSLFFQNTVVEKGVTYYYEVTAVNQSGESARSNEISASLSAAAGSTTTKSTPSPASGGGAGIVPILGLLVALLVAVGVLVLVRSRMASQPAPASSLASGVPLLPEDRLGPGDTFGPDVPFASLDRMPPSVDLPAANPLTGGGLLSRFTDPTSADTLVPSPISAAAQPPTSAYDMSITPPTPPPPPRVNPVGNATFPATDFAMSQSEVDALSSGSTFPATDWQRSGAGGATFGGQAPIWPVARPVGVGQPPIDARRSLLLVGAGICAILGIIALGLFIFFNLSGNTSAAPNATQPVVLQNTATTTLAPTVTVASSPTLPVAAAVAIACGSDQAIGPFSADMDVQGGTADSQSGTVDTSGVTNPAPEQVYQNERYGEFTYIITGLVPNANYTVRLHFAEIYFHNPDERRFNVTIGGQRVLHNFDIVQEAGGMDKAIVREFPATADGSGNITIAFTNGSVNFAKCSGIQLVPSS
jgi:hypothetical protein